MSFTSVIRYVRALDNAATDGSGKTGLVFGGITAKYLTQGGTLTALTTQDITTLGTYQAPTDASHIRIKELSAGPPTDGVYEVHFHNTQVAATGQNLWLFLSATGAAFTPLKENLQDDFSAVEKTSIGTAVAASAVASVTGNVGGTVNDIASPGLANVKLQVVGALATDTYDEPGQAAPPHLTTLATKIGYIFKAWRNKSDQTATKYELYNQDASTVDQKATVSDDGTTFTRGATASGP